MEGTTLAVLAHWAVCTAALFLTAYFVPGIKLTSLAAGMFAVIMIGLVNALVRPILFFLTFPLTVLTLGLFLFILNGLALKIASTLSPGFTIQGFLPAVLGSIVLTLIGILFQAIFQTRPFP